MLKPVKPAEDVADNYVQDETPNQTIDDIPLDELETLHSFDRDAVQSKSAYSISYDGNILVIAGKFRVFIDSILSMDSLTVNGFKSTVEAVAQASSRAPSTLASQVRVLEKAIRNSSITNFSPENYQKLITNVSNDNINTCCRFLTLWYRLGYQGVDYETIDIANNLKRPGTKHRARVKSEDDNEGWYTDQEYQDLVDSYWLNYEAGVTNLRNTSMFMLNAQFGRRGVQVASLKVMDFQCEGETDGITGRRIAFPGAKDRTAEEWFRGAKLDVHPVGDDLWDLCQLQIKSTISLFEKWLGRELSDEERNQLPFIHPEHAGKKRRIAMKSPDYPLAAILPTSEFHVSAGVVAQTLATTKGDGVISHRTGEKIFAHAYRMRYTRARQLARLGVPRLTLQYWLGHEDDASIEYYYNDPAEDARILNDEIKHILGSLAQAFAGTIRDKESDATRGRDPASRVELDGRYNVGSCGEHGYCSASVPIPCYKCSKFEPWVDGPHDEVLIRLLERQEEENNIRIPSKSRRILAPLQLEKDISAVKLVIRLCDARKNELAAMRNSQHEQQQTLREAQSE